jgi:xylitol oxidase
MSSAYSVSLFTDWSQDVFNQVWIKSLADGDNAFKSEPVFYGATQATEKLHPIVSVSAEPCTPQMGEAGAWYDRLPHFRMAFKPSRGDELQTEFFIARKDAYQALLALNEIREQIAPLLWICEIRTIARDDLWMSPCYQADRVALHFTWKFEWEAVEQLLPVLEAQIAPFNPRPHWGKLFTLAPEIVQSRYAKLGDFRDLVTDYDPDGKFRNAFLDTYIF